MDAATDHGGKQRGRAQFASERATTGERPEPRGRRSVAGTEPADHGFDADERPDPLANRRARAAEELAHGAVAGPEASADLGVAQALELAHYDRVALADRKRLDDLQQPVQLDAAIARVVEPAELLRAAGQALGPRRPGAEDVARRVGGDRVQPRSEVVDFVATLQRPMRLDQRVLDRFLGVALTDDPRAVPDQRAAVAGHDRFEGRVRAVARQVRQALVALRAQDRARQTRRGIEAGIHRSAFRDRVQATRRRSISAA